MSASSSAHHAFVSDAPTKLREIRRRLAWTVLLAPAFAMAGVVIWLAIRYAFLAYPQADDLVRAADSRTLSLPTMVLREYIWWNTRWLGMVIEKAGEWDSGLVARYPWQLLGGMGLLYAACCCIASVISGCHLTSKRVLAAGALGFAVVWLTVPYGEALYWWPATVEYLLPTSLLMVLLWVMAERRGRVGFLVTVALAFAIPAFHELMGFWVVGGMGLLLVLSLLRPDGRAACYLAPMAAAALGAASVLVGPGLQHHLALTHRMPVLEALQDAPHWIGVTMVPSSWRLLLPALAVVALIAYRNPEPPVWYRAAPRLSLALLLGAATGLPYAAVAVTMHVQTGVPARVFDEAYLLGAGCAAGFAAACGYALRRWASTRPGGLGSWGGGALALAALVCLGSAVALPRLRQALHDIPAAEANREVVAQQMAQLRAAQASGVADVVVDGHLSPVAMLPTWLGLTDKPDDFANHDAAFYFGLKSVRVR